MDVLFFNMWKAITLFEPSQCLNQLRIHKLCLPASDSTIQPVRQAFTISNIHWWIMQNKETRTKKGQHFPVYTMGSWLDVSLSFSIQLFSFWLLKISSSIFKESGYSRGIYKQRLGNLLIFSNFTIVADYSIKIDINPAN